HARRRRVSLGPQDPILKLEWCTTEKNGGMIGEMKDELRPIDTSTALLARLFARWEGPGRLLISVPGGMEDLADRLVEPSYFQTKAFRKVGREYRWIFGVRSDARRFVDSLLCIGSGALAADRWALGEVLLRVSLSGLETRPLSKLE